jgi:DNA-binding GntR family transcriptional regulator
MPVGEAFRALAGERLLEIVPYKGAIVKRIDEDFISGHVGALAPGSIYDGAAMKRIGEKEIQTLLDIKRQGLCPAGHAGRRGPLS